MYTLQWHYFCILMECGLVVQEKIKAKAEKRLYDREVDHSSEDRRASSRRGMGSRRSRIRERDQEKDRERDRDRDRDQERRSRRSRSRERSRYNRSRSRDRDRYRRSRSRSRERRRRSRSRSKERRRRSRSPDERYVGDSEGGVLCRSCWLFMEHRQVCSLMCFPFCACRSRYRRSRS